MVERSISVGLCEFVKSFGSTSPTPAGGAAAAASVASPPGVVGLGLLALSTFAPFSHRTKEAPALDGHAGLQLRVMVGNRARNPDSLRSRWRFGGCA